MSAKGVRPPRGLDVMPGPERRARLMLAESWRQYMQAGTEAARWRDYPHGAELAAHEARWAREYRERCRLLAFVISGRYWHPDL